MTSREPAFSGLFYPAFASELRRQIESCFSDKKFGPGNGRIKPEKKILAGIAPHAGYVYSGPCAAQLYSRIPHDTKTVVILGPNHTGRGSGISASDADSWETPLGKVGVDGKLRQKILDNSKIIDCESSAHAGEHSIEVQLPFLQTVLNDFRIVPVCMMGGDDETCREVGGAIAKAVSGMKNVLLLASTDFSHYVSKQEAEMKDSLAIGRIMKLDPEGLIDTVEKIGISMCGPMAVASVLFAAKSLGAKKAELLRHYTSGEITGDYSQGVVGYASLVVR